MAMLNNELNISKVVSTGNEQDYCYFCSLEIPPTTRDDLYNKINSLKGKLVGQPVMRINKRGESTCICKEHIKQAFDIMYPGEECIATINVKNKDESSIQPESKDKNKKGDKNEDAK